MLACLRLTLNNGNGLACFGAWSFVSCRSFQLFGGFLSFRSFRFVGFVSFSVSGFSHDANYRVGCTGNCLVSN